jgi:hypothetical protein
MNTGIFPPEKRTGLLLHGFLIALLAAVSAWGFWHLAGAAAGPAFVLYLLLGLLAFIPIPLLGYRAFALFRAQYKLDRNSLELRWGLRDELVPLGEIEWVRSAKDLLHPVALPAIRIPGAIIGFRRHADLGVIEFLASQSRDLLLVAARDRVFAISPAQPAEFMATFARAVELGSLREAKPKSQYASFVITDAWESGLVRFVWLAAFFLNVGLAAWISLLIPSRAQFALGFRPDATPDAVPSAQIVIVPLVSALLSLIGWIAGLFLYRWPRWRVLAVIVWGSSMVSSLAFLLGVLFIVTTPA